jgi:hypothetical protein
VLVQLTLEVEVEEKVEVLIQVEEMEVQESLLLEHQELLEYP